MIDNTSKRSSTSANTKHLYNIVQRRPDVFDVGQILYKCYTNVLRLIGRHLLHLQVSLMSICVDNTTCYHMYVNYTNKAVAHQVPRAHF